MSSAAASKPKRIRIFRAGTFTSMEGRSVSFGADELQAIADAYDAASDPAPLVIGHPKTDDPAFGWVDRLAVEDDRLVAYPGKVEPSFAEEVNAGRYQKVSAQFYPPEHPANPAPGQYYLKHVGFLGAAAPAVKGLGTVSLADGAEHPLLTIEQEKNMSAPDKKDEAASFAEREAALAAREKAADEREKKAAKAAADARHAANVSFAEGLVKDAKLAPAGKPLLIGVLDALGEGEAVSFGEGVELTPAAALKKLFDTAQPLVSLGEAAADKGGPAAKLASFAAPAGYEVDPKQAALFARAKALQAENPKLEWMDAVRRAETQA